MVIPEPAPDEISLYFHIPFCKKKCGYCHFFVVHDQKEWHDPLIKGFLFEINQAKEILKGRTLKSIYFGGGTPSLLDPKNISIILNAVDKVINIPQSTEITMEFNPESSDKEMFAKFQQAGINRASIGIQSFDDAFLKTLTREHTAEKGQRAVRDAFASGIHNITIDLMYEIPHQTRTLWQQTLRTALSLPITHFSLYNLTFEEGTAFIRKRNALALYLPSDEDAKEMLLEATHTFNENGFYQYEISAFAKPGFHSCHNTGYWLARDFLGFGPAAFSYLKGKRSRNCDHLKRYFTETSHNRLPMDFEEELSSEGKIRELLIINLRLNAGLISSTFEQRHGQLSQDLNDTLRDLVNEGFLEENQDRIRLTDHGRLFFNEVAARIVE